MPIGTFINTAAVIFGSLVGLAVRRQIPKPIQAIIFDAMGLITIALSLTMIFKMENFLIVAFSVVLGSIIGELIGIEKRLETMGEAVKRKLHAKSDRFTEGMMTAFLLFCIGPMTILGTINEGLVGDRSLLLTKSILDGFTSIIFATTFGIGVLFSAAPLFIFQATLTVLAAQLQGFFTQFMISQLTATAGVLLLGVGVNLLELKKIKVANMLPALVIVIILQLVLEQR